MNPRWSITAAIAVAFIGAWSAPGEAVSRRVSEAESLQPTIDASAPGDSVMVEPGEYGRIVMRDGVAVIATGGPADTILLSGDLWCVRADSLEFGAVLEGFTLDGDKAAEGVVTINDSKLTVSDCRLQNAWSGIRAMYSEVTIRQSEVTTCQNGIYFLETDGRINDCTVSQCIAGVNLVSASPTLERNEITDNSVGVLLSEHSNPRIGGSVRAANRFARNRSGNIHNRALQKRFSVRTTKPMTLRVPFNFWGSDCPDSLGFRGPVEWTPWIDESGSRTLESCASAETN